MTVRLPDPPEGRKRPRPPVHRGRVRTGAITLLLAACASAGAPASPSTLDPDDWIERTLESMTLRERVGQLVMVWMTGGYASSSDAEFVRVESLVREQGIGGVVISVGTPHAYVSRLNRLQSVAPVPLLVAADFEAGPGFRVGGAFQLPTGISLGGATAFPPAMAFGATNDEELAYEAGRITGLEARALGVHLNFAPVLDVNNNPENPIINTRSFGEDPDRVAALGAAYIRGARDAGLMTTAKHFPGHGDTGTDSHVELPIIPGDRARLDALELVPFRRAIDAGVDAVMTAHVAAPGILEDDELPATLSHYFMTELLREDLGFDGVLFTDALDMGAIVSGYGAGDASVRAIEAGADVLLMPPDPERAIDAVVRAVETGRLTEARIEESARRVLAMKTRAGLDAATATDPGAVPGVVGTEAHLSFADSVAERALTLVRDLPGAFPLDTVATDRVLSIAYARRLDVAAGRVFDARLREALDVRAVTVEGGIDERDVERLLERAAGVDAVVLSLHSAPAVDEDDDAPHPLDGLIWELAAQGVPTTVISFGSPYVLSVLPDAWTYLVAWGGTGAEQRAAADALLGRRRVGGDLPISLPPIYRMGEGLRRAGPADPPVAGRQPGPEVAAETVGMDADLLARVDRLIQQAISDSVTPGAALAVGRRGHLVRLRGYGRLDWDGASARVTETSRYDLASLTKVIATTTAVMSLVDEGLIDLDERVGSYLDEWSRGWKADVTLRDLILHQAGLPPFRPFWRDHEGRAAYRRSIADLESEYSIGERMVYSDIGLITLQFVIEQVTGEPLDVVARGRVFDPLGMSATGFNPPPESWSTVAPTEIDTVYRHRLVHGEVHDENASALGGVAGHAGLFSSARDLARFGGWILDAARAGRAAANGDVADAGPDHGPRSLPGADTPGLPAPSTVAEFTRRVRDLSSRALGWDTPSGRSSAGRFFAGGSFGHTGFTGTSIWVDPERDVFVVLLTNRVNPTRAERGHIPLRRAVHDAVATAITDMPIEPRSRP